MQKINNFLKREGLENEYIVLKKESVNNIRMYSKDLSVDVLVRTNKDNTWQAYYDFESKSWIRTNTNKKIEDDVLIWWDFGLNR